MEFTWAFYKKLDLSQHPQTVSLIFQWEHKPILRRFNTVPLVRQTTHQQWPVSWEFCLILWALSQQPLTDSWHQFNTPLQTFLDLIIIIPLPHLNQLKRRIELGVISILTFILVQMPGLPHPADSGKHVSWNARWNFAEQIVIRPSSRPPNTSIWTLSRNDNAHEPQPRKSVEAYHAQEY